MKERVEEKAGQALARAESAVKAAQGKVEAARQLASQDFRARADISAWEVTELAHHRALSDARKAQRELEAVQRSATVVRAQYVSAHQAAEVVRRVAEKRRDEAQAELNRVEDKQLDETTALLFARKAG